MEFGEFDDDEENDKHKGLKHKSDKTYNNIIPLLEGEIRIEVNVANMKVSEDNTETSEDEMEKTSKSLISYIVDKEINNTKGHNCNQIRMDIKLFREQNKIDIIIPEYGIWNPNILKGDTLNKIVDSLKSFGIEYAKHSFLTINLLQEKYRGNIISRELYKSYSIVCIDNNEKPKQYRVFFTASSIEKNLKDINPNMRIKEITNNPSYFKNIMIPAQLFTEEIKENKLKESKVSKLIKVTGKGYQDNCGNLHLQDCYINSIKIMDKGYDKNNRA